jgi:hypothetical protein
MVMIKSFKYLLISLFIATPSLAVDNGQWGNVDPATREWFKGLKSPLGTPCCDFADGNRIDDPDYKENDDGSYEVNVPEHGGWHHVTKDRIVTATNRIGYAVIWWGKGSTEPYCFLPGARG